MIKKETIRFSALCILLVTLSACGGGSSGGTSPTYSCTLPCLDSAPLLDTATVSSASGGIVKVTFTLSGDITNVSNVLVILTSTDLMTGNVAGSEFLINPTQATNTLDIIVAAGGTVATDTYYPWVIITANSPLNSGGQYILEPTSSSSLYTYSESIGGSAPTPVLTSFTVPTFQVTP